MNLCFVMYVHGNICMINVVCGATPVHNFTHTVHILQHTVYFDNGGVLSAVNVHLYALSAMFP